MARFITCLTQLSRKCKQTRRLQKLNLTAPVAKVQNESFFNFKLNKFGVLCSPYQCKIN